MVQIWQGGYFQSCGDVLLPGTFEFPTVVESLLQRGAPRHRVVEWFSLANTADGDLDILSEKDIFGGFLINNVKFQKNRNFFQKILGGGFAWDQCSLTESDFDWEGFLGHLAGRIEGLKFDDRKNAQATAEMQSVVRQIADSIE